MLCLYLKESLALSRVCIVDILLPFEIRLLLHNVQFVKVDKEPEQQSLGEIEVEAENLQCVNAGELKMRVVANEGLQSGSVFRQQLLLQFGGSLNVKADIETKIRKFYVDTQYVIKLCTYLVRLD